MEINKDQLVEGPFGSNACYEQVITDGNDNTTITTWLCFGSGYSSSTLMTEGSKTVADLLETAPELHKDLLHVDDQKRVWAPATITIPEKGMVFVDGTSKEDWKWSGVKAIEIQKADREKYPEGQTHKMDMKNGKQFGRKDFMDALEYIGFYNV
jgi:hypothetical protein